MSDTPTTPAGWYDDGSGRRRYWDGAAWTDHFETPPVAPGETPTPSYGEAPADPSGTAPTQAYGSAPTDAYGTAPTQAYGDAPTQAYSDAPTQAYGAPVPPYAGAPAPGGQPQYGQAPYGQAPYGQGPGPYAAPGQQAAPTAYAAPAGYAPPRTASPADSRPSVLGLVALGIAVIGLVLSFIPIANIGGWVLLPVALILGIVAFFLQGRKWPAIAAVIVAVVGGIAAIVMAFVFAFLAFGAAVSNLPDVPDLPGGESTVAPPDDEASATPDDSDSGSGEIGTVDNPAPIGSTITGEEYTIVINSVTLGADDQIVTDGGNPPADEGLSYVLVNATVTYTGSESSGNGFSITIDYLAPDGTTYTYGENAAFPPDPDINFIDLPQGQPVTGNTVLAIPVAADGVLSVTPGFFDDPVYVALR